MTDTCDRCHRPRAATYDDWCDECDSLGAREVTPSCGYGDYRDDFCTAARDAWQTAEIARLTAELASERQRSGWRTIGVDPDPAPGQWCVLLTRDSAYPACVAQWRGDDWEYQGGFWGCHQNDKWLPLPSKPATCTRCGKPDHDFECAP